MVELYQIYLITNKNNNKKYIGQVVQHRGYEARFHEHLWGVKYANTRRLSSSIGYHGKDAFIVELIEDNIPEDIIDEREKYYIKKYDTSYFNGFGYNMTLGGQGIHGYHHTEATKHKISESSKKHWNNLYKDEEKLFERNKNISIKLTGRVVSDSTKKKQSARAIARFKNECGTFKDKHHSEETKRKLAIAHNIPVGMYDKNTEALIKTFESATEASKYLNDQGLTKNKSANTRIHTICNKIKGQGKTAYGYIWNYLK